MKKKLYKYKWVYWLIILITIIYSITFNFATYTRIKNTKYFTENIYHNILILIIGLLSLFTLYFLIRKNNYAIIFFNISNSLILFAIVFNIFKRIFLPRYLFIQEDYIFFPIFIVLFSLFIFINKRFTYLGNNFVDEIDEIGKSEN